MRRTIMANWCSARTRYWGTCLDVRLTSSSRDLTMPAAAWWQAVRMPCIKSGRSSICGCVWELPRMRRPYRAGEGHCRRRKGGPRGDFRYRMFHPRPRPVMGLDGRRHRALPCGRADPCPHPERQAPLPRRHLGKSRC